MAIIDVSQGFVPLRSGLARLSGFVESSTRTCIGSISANLEEGFGRGVQSKAYDQFLRYSLGSAREAKGWYYRSRHILSADLMELRLSLLEEIISLLVSTLKRRQTAQTRNS